MRGSVPPPLVRAMLDPSFYPQRPAAVELVQTHISWVFLAGDQAWKVKKPVDFGFLNFTTLARRGYCCRREVELNLRLAPHLYRGVVPIRSADGRSFSPGGRGRVVEYAVVMNRVPAGSLLVDRLAGGTVTGPMMARFGEYLAAFHARAPHGPRVSRYGSAAAVRRNNEEDIAQLAPYAGRTIAAGDLAAITDYSRDWLRRWRGLLERRVAGGRIRDGHGDLHVEHVGWEGGRPFAMDCIEFTPRFRCADVAAEVAFLAMDLEHRGAWPMARAFLEGYLDASGDEEIRPLLDFYRCYRAAVRAKVSSLLAGDPRLDEAGRRSAAERAGGYLARGAAYARRDAPPMVVAATGLLGTGKTNVGRRLADNLGFRSVVADEVRKRLAGLNPAARVGDPWGAGLYSPEMGEKTYRAILEEGRRLVRAGHNVFLDATFSRNAHRQAARAMASEEGARFRLIETVCPEEVSRERLLRRAARGTAVSDGRWEIYGRHKASYQVPAGLPDGELLEVDTTGTKDETWARVLRGVFPLSPVDLRGGRA
jgi:aminoglycoside phosphotransferase family enzyme/predicted kinase